MNQYNIGDLIKKFRKRSGISQLTLESKIGASFGSISKFENGKVSPSKETIEKIINVLDLSTHEAALLYSLDINEYKSHLSAINRIHMQPDLQTAIKITANELYQNLGLQSVGIFLVEGNELVLSAVGQRAEIHKAIEDLGVRRVSIRYPLDAKYSNIILDVFKKKEMIVYTHLQDAIKPAIPATLAKLVQSVTKLTSVCFMPILDGSRNSLGVIALCYERRDLVSEKLPIIDGYIDAISVVVNRFSK